MALSGTERKKMRTRQSLSSGVNSPSGRDARKNSMIDDVVYNKENSISESYI
jgi:hypothetical protein